MRKVWPILVVALLVILGTSPAAAAGPLVVGSLQLGECTPYGGFWDFDGTRMIVNIHGEREAAYGTVRFIGAYNWVEDLTGNLIVDRDWLIYDDPPGTCAISQEEYPSIEWYRVEYHPSVGWVFIHNIYGTAVCGVVSGQIVSEGDRLY